MEVYDEDGVKEFAFHSADSFLMTSSVSRNGKEMAAVTMGQSQGSFTSSIVLYKLDRQEAYATCDLAGVAPCDSKRTFAAEPAVVFTSILRALSFGQ